MQEGCQERRRPERGAKPPSESERGWGPRAVSEEDKSPIPITHGIRQLPRVEKASAISRANARLRQRRRDRDDR
jgi:hypothetical protein